MSAPVYSTTLIQWRGLVGDRTVVPPTSSLFIVRDVWMYWNPQDIDITRVHLIGDVGQTFGYFEFDLANIVQMAFWQGRAVLQSSFTVSVSGSPVDITASGYVLTLP